MPKRVSFLCGGRKCACVQQAKRPGSRRHKLFLTARSHYMRALASIELPADNTRSRLKTFEFRAADSPVYQDRFLHRRPDGSANNTSMAGGRYDPDHYREYRDNNVRMHGPHLHRRVDVACCVCRPLQCCVVCLRRNFLSFTRALSCLCAWRMHCGVEVTESSTNKQHTLSLRELY